MHPETKAGIAGGVASGISRRTIPESGIVQTANNNNESGKFTVIAESAITDEATNNKDLENIFIPVNQENSDDTFEPEPPALSFDRENK